MAIDKKVYINGNTVKFNMDVTKDKSGKITSPTHSIAVTVDVTGVTREMMLSNNFSGSSMRVKLQNTHLRPLSEVKLRELAESGYSTTWKDIDSGAPQKSAKDLLLELSKKDFIELMTEEYNLTPKRAETMYNIKHRITVPNPTK